jgi:hypothetical protein
MGDLRYNLPSIKHLRGNARSGIRALFANSGDS